MENLLLVMPELSMHLDSFLLWLLWDLLSIG